MRKITHFVVKCDTYPYYLVHEYVGRVEEGAFKGNYRWIDKSSFRPDSVLGEVTEGLAKVLQCTLDRLRGERRAREKEETLSIRCSLLDVLGALPDNFIPIKYVKENK